MESESQAERALAVVIAKLNESCRQNVLNARKQARDAGEKCATLAETKYETLNAEIADLNQKVKTESKKLKESNAELQAKSEKLKTALESNAALESKIEAAEAAEKRAEAAENSKSCDKDSGDGKSLRVQKKRTDAFLIDSHFIMTAGSSDDHKPEDDGDSSDHEESSKNLKPAAKRKSSDSESASSSSKKPKVAKHAWIQLVPTANGKGGKGNCVCGKWGPGSRSSCYSIHINPMKEAAAAEASKEAAAAEAS